MSITTRHRIVLFLVLTYALSFDVYIRGPMLALMWCPGVAALIVRLVTQRNLRGAGWNWGATRWQVLSYLSPPALCVMVYGLVWLTGIGSFTAAVLAPGKGVGVQIPLPVTIVLLATVGLLQGAVFALGEEIGSRGFLVPDWPGFRLLW